MRNENSTSRIFSSVFVIAPDKGFFDIGVCNVDTASCNRIVGSIDCTIVCSEGDVFLCRELCSLPSDDRVELSIRLILVSSYYCRILSFPSIIFPS